MSNNCHILGEGGACIRLRDRAWWRWRNSGTNTSPGGGWHPATDHQTAVVFLAVWISETSTENTTHMQHNAGNDECDIPDDDDNEPDQSIQKLAFV